MQHIMLRNISHKFIFTALIATSTFAHALEFKSVSAQKAILYDAPSTSSKKMLLLSQAYPVEVIVNLKDWLKVRDALGTIYWVEAKDLTNTRTVLVKTDTKLLAKNEVNAATVATIEKNVLLQIAETQVVNGYIKVKHRDGVTGYLPITVLWGAN